MDCGKARTHLTDLLYGDLSHDLRTAVETHLETCDECRVERAALERTTRALDAWGPVEAPSDARGIAELAVVRAVERPVGPSRTRSRWRQAAPWLVGMAAGLLLFASLVVLGAEISVTDGRLVVAVGAAPETEDDGLERAIHDEIGRDRELTLEAIEGYLQEWEAAQNDRYYTLIQAIESTRDRDRERFDRVVEAVVIGAEDARRTRDALDRVIHFVSLEQNAPFGYGPNGRMEIVP